MFAAAAVAVLCDPRKMLASLDRKAVFHPLFANHEKIVRSSMVLGHKLHYSALQDYSFPPIEMSGEKQAWLLEDIVSSWCEFDFNQALCTSAGRSPHFTSCEHIHLPLNSSAQDMCQ